MNTSINNSENLFISPSTITIITTHRCTSACGSCCFSCSPSRKESLSVEEILSVIEVSCETFPGIRNIVLTGGEVITIGFPAIKRIIEFSKSHGLSTRIVTNAYWASTPNKAQEVLRKLASYGLDEINFSTGDEHLKFVPIINILNAIKACDEINTIKTCAVVIESGETKVFKKEDFTKEFDSFFGKGYKSKLILLSSPWVDLTEKTLSFSPEELQKKQHIYRKNGCDNIFTGIQVNPKGQILACCGFAAEYSPFLKMGKFPNTSQKLKNIYKEHSLDLLKMWLFLDGPRGIFDYFNKDKSCKQSMHDCEICTRILLDRGYIEKIASISPEKVTDILYRMQFKTNNILTQQV